MPALPPPSMQIAGLPNGATTVTPLPGGPGLQYGFIENPPSILQARGQASSSAAPASFTVNPSVATTVGTTLVLFVAAACSGAPTIAAPAGWTTVTGASSVSAGNTIATRCFVLPAPLNTVSISSILLPTLTNVNGVAVYFAECLNTQTVDPVYSGQATTTNGSTTPSAPIYTAPAQGPLLLIGIETDLTGQVYTAANVGANWTNSSSATSTSGVTNCVIRGFSVVTQPEIQQGNYQLAGTLAGSLANGGAMVSLLAGTTGPLTAAQTQPYGFPSGAAGWAWGALGNTKPGGAGGGQ